MRWIKTHKLISFLIAIIVACVVILTLSISSSGSSNPIAKGINSVCVTILKPVNKVTDGITENVSGIFKYRKLQDENDALIDENNKLKQQLMQEKLSSEELSELKRLAKSLNYKGIDGSTDVVSADIVSSGDTDWLNTFTINVGSKDGVELGDIVVSGSGLVGKVDSLGKSWAKVRAIIDESSKISFKISGNLKIFGVIDGCSNGELSGFMLDSKAKVNKGDIIITSGMGIYPTGLEIGKITKVKYDRNAQLERVTVKSTIDFTSLQKVTVLI